MGKITEEARKKYTDKIIEYKQTIDSILAHEKTVLDAAGKNPSGAAFMRITLADDMLNLISYYLLLNNLSVSLLGVKNEDALNEARKTVYKVLIYLEEVVSPFIDVPYSDYEAKLEEIAALSEEQRYDLIRKIGFAIKSVEDAFGDNSKWKWSFVEIEGRFATVAKNLFDMKAGVKNMEPGAPSYEASVLHFRLIKKLFQQAADRYREKYELSTMRIDDFKLAISYLSALRRIEALLGDRDEAESLKKKIEIWSQKMENDVKKIESEKGKI